MPTAEWLSTSQIPSLVSQSFEGGTVPVRLQADVDDFGAQDRRGPLDGVDLRDQRGDDQPRRLVDALVAPAAIVGAQLVAQQVVLAREHGVQAAEAQPPALVEAGHLLPAGVLRQVALLVQPELRSLPQGVGLRRVRAVDLGPVPPVRGLVREHRVDRMRPRVGEGHVAGDPHLLLRRPARGVRPLDALGHLDPDVVLPERTPRVVHPVVHLELDPGSGQQVQRARGNEVLPVEQLLADHDRVRLVEQVLTEHRGDVAPEGCTHRTHGRVGEVVVAAVVGPGQSRLLGRGGRRHRARAGRSVRQPGVDEVLLAQLVPERLQVQQPEPSRKTVPVDVAVHHAEHLARSSPDHLVVQRDR